MGIDLLDAPVRLTWDLHGPGAPLDRETMLAVAGRIAAAGVFYVTLQERPLLHPAISAILGTLATGGCRVSVICSGASLELESACNLAKVPASVQLDAALALTGSGFDPTPLAAALETLRQAGIDPLVTLIPLRSNLAVIPELFAFCQSHGVGCFKLPNARIGDTFRGYGAEELPGPDDLDRFRALWQRGLKTAAGATKLEIHDRFLWEIMTPGDDQARSEYGGCQAANSLGHVDAQGTVFACEAWPEPLGSLLDMELEEIWQSPRRHAVRERVAAIPDGCRGCRDYALCLGGCRGLGECLGESGGGRDLMCRAPRS